MSSLLLGNRTPRLNCYLSCVAPNIMSTYEYRNRLILLQDHKTANKRSNIDVALQSILNRKHPSFNVLICKKVKLNTTLQPRGCGSFG